MKNFYKFLKIKRFLKITEAKPLKRKISLEISKNEISKEIYLFTTAEDIGLPQPPPEFGSEAALKFLKFLRNLLNFSQFLKIKKFYRQKWRLDPHFC